MLKHLIYLLLSGLFLTSCSISYTKAMKFGEISSERFNETVHVESINNLLIVPVVIQGKTYRFLFDTGAPFSISKELQNEFQYTLLSKATLTDSDKSRSSLPIVQVDGLFIGDIAFTNQTAFVGDFKQNAILACMQIDGIIGSNLMRHCNWTVDMQNEVIHLYKGITKPKQEAFVTIPFKKNVQYDIILDLNVEHYTIPNVKIDYGSNGSLTLPSKSFSNLKSKTSKTALSSHGFVQSGLFGVRKPFNSEVLKVDSLWMGDVLMNNILIKSGKSTLLGGKILTNYIVDINWDNETISLAKHLHQYHFDEVFGFKIGVTDKLIIQSVLERTPADTHGLQPNMEIIKIDHLDFTKQHTLCDYMDYFKEERTSIHLVYKTIGGLQKEVTLTKKSPF